MADPAKPTAATAAQTPPARLAPAAVRPASVFTAAPFMNHLVVDNPHNLLYGSDGSGGMVWVFSLPTLTKVATIPLGSGSMPYGMALSPDGTRLAVALQGASFMSIVVIDTTSATYRVVETLTPSSGIPAVVCFGRTDRLYSAGAPQFVNGVVVPDSIHVWSLSTGTEAGHSAPSSNGVFSLAITADGNSLYETDNSLLTPGLARYDITTDTPVATGAPPADQQDTTVAVKPDGSRVYDSSGYVWSADLRTRIGIVQGGGFDVSYAAGGDVVVMGGTCCGQSTTSVFRANGTTLAAMASTTISGQAFAIVANAAGTLAYASQFAPVTGVEVIDFPPTAPSGAGAGAGIGSALVIWSPPTDSGTSPVTSYYVFSSSGDRVSVPATQTKVALTGLSAAVSYTFTVYAVNASGPGPGLVTNTVTPEPGGTYHPLSPARILDTRDGTGGFTSPLGPGGALNLQVSGRGGVPMAGVSAVVLNVTATDTTASSFLTVWPTGTSLPVVSNLNWVPRETVPNLVEVALGGGGMVSLYNLTGSVDVVADVEGWVGDATNSSGPLGMFNALTPARLLDTRQTGGPLGTGQSLNLQVTGRGGVPSSGVAAVVLNVTATDTTGSSFMTVWPTGTAMPLASNLNWVPGQTVPNRVIVKLGAGGQINIFNQQGSVDVVVDVSGWFTDATSLAGGSGFVATIPGRLYDERNDPAGPLPGGFFILFKINDPRTITALVLNVTVTDTTAPSFLTVYTGGVLPVASDLNWVAGETVPNLTVAQVLGPQKEFNVYNFAGLVDVVLDVDGFYSGVVGPVSAMVTAPAAVASLGSNQAQSSPGTQRIPTATVVHRGSVSGSASDAPAGRA